MPNAAIILAAGRGARIRNSTLDKILVPLAGRPALVYSIDAFAESECVETIAIVYRDETQRQALESALAGSRVDADASNHTPVDLLWVKGGTERQDSVLNGLQALRDGFRFVFIHDAARPLISPESIRLLAEKVGEHGAACLARRVVDTVKKVRATADLAVDAVILQTIDRSSLWAVETPQVFDFQLILDAYRKTSHTGRRLTDDTAALEGSGHPVSFVESLSPNPKLTTPADISYVEHLLTSRA